MLLYNMGENIIPKIHDRSLNVDNRLQKLITKLDRVSWGDQPKADEKEKVDTSSCLAGIEEDLVRSQNYLQVLEERINHILGEDDKIVSSNP